MDTVFDAAHTERILAERLRMAGSVLTYAHDKLNADTLADVGCGVGNASRLLSKNGWTVTGYDLRQANVTEALARSADERYFVNDIEHATIAPHDVIFCIGLLYHLENPMAALRHIAAATRKVLVLESRVVPGTGAFARLVQEGPGIDQSGHGVALVPSRDLLVATLAQSGLHVYELTTYPTALKDFVWVPAKKWRRRVMLFASRAPLPTTLGVVALKPSLPLVGDIWR